ncbi:hypothetical protein GGI12_003040 [Dipsacomyces acuminosporus]|nr:hypothetical protein GGI12_003040 [Dipsacomyces acuminosporus]
MDDDYYLEPGFDPSALKVSSIRNILVKHEVEYPSNAKKGELLGILQTSVLNKAPKLRKEARRQRRVKADGRDIEVVATTSASASIASRVRAKASKTEGEKSDKKASGSSSREVSAEPSGLTEKKAKKKAKKAKLLALALAKEESSVSASDKEPQQPATPEKKKPDNKLKSKLSKKRKHTADSDSERREGSVDSGDEHFFTPAKPKVSEAQRQRIAKRRVLQTDLSAHGSGRSAGVSDSESEHSDAGMARKPVTANTEARKPRSGNFSDENPFQSSPEASRKRRRKTSAAKASNTPMSALRKSQISDVSFKVSLPTSPLGARSEQKASHESMEVEVEAEAELGPELPEASVEQPVTPPAAAATAAADERTGTLQRSRVSDLVAKYQSHEQAQSASSAQSPPLSPTVRIRDGLKKTESATLTTSSTSKQHESVRKSSKTEVEPIVDIMLPSTPPPPPPPQAVPAGSHPSAQHQHQHQQLFDVGTSPEDSGKPATRFTMTPDALRQMASERSAAIADPVQPPRRKTAAAAGLPPVAPNIPVNRADIHPQSSRLHYHSQQQHHTAAPPASDHHSEQSKHAPYPSIEQAESDAQSLQRRRVATLRQRRDSTDGSIHSHTHSRRSSIASIASSVGEARGIPAIPTPAAAAVAAAESSSRAAGAKESSSWTMRALVWATLGVAAYVWRAHEQFSIGFSSSRSDYASLAPPAGSALALPEPIDMENAPLLDRANYYVKFLRAAYVSPPALQCPEHAECVPHTPIPASFATQHSVSDVATRDQWIVPVIDATAEEGTPNEMFVPVVHCDQGYVLQFPKLSSRFYPRLPVCVRDASTEHRVQQLAAAMIQECDNKRGKVQCEMSLYEQARELLSRSSATKFALLLADPACHTPNKDSSASSEQNVAAEAESEAADDENDEADEVERLGLSVKELKKIMYSCKSPRLSNEEFDAAFKLAIDELANKHVDSVANFILEFEEEDGGEGSEVMYFVSRNPAYPLLCRARRLALSSVIGNLTGLLVTIFLSVVAFVVSRRYSAHRAEIRAADALVVSALEKLKRQARRHYLDPALSPSPAIPSLQLRDLLLLSSTTPTNPTPSEGSSASLDALSLARSGASYYDPRARNNVWERVRKVVERNANVRCRTTAVRGEPMRVWEWIGPLDHDDSDDIFTPFGSPLASPQRLSSPIGLDRPLE